MAAKVERVKYSYIELPYGEVHYDYDPSEPSPYFEWYGPGQGYNEDGYFFKVYTGPRGSKRVAVHGEKHDLAHNCEAYLELTLKTAKELVETVLNKNAVPGTQVTRHGLSVDVVNKNLFTFKAPCGDTIALKRSSLTALQKFFEAESV